MESLLDRLLRHYSLSLEGYGRLKADPSFSLLPKLDAMMAISAKNRIARAKEANEKVLIYGDYDCDGIMASAIMARTLHKLGIKAEVFIPSRYKDGYGLNEENAKRIASNGYGLVILVDNGVSCLSPISYLYEKGIDCIAIDHHDVGSTLPPCTLIHDRLIGLEEKCSAGALCFYFSSLLLGEVDYENLVMGAVSVISDVMPMKGENRTLVGLCLRLLRKGYGRRVLALLDAFPDERGLSMSAIPKINAPGRILEDQRPLIACAYYFAGLSKDPMAALRIMEKAKERRVEMTAEAEKGETIEESGNALFYPNPGLEGLGGLLANRLLEQKGKQTIVVSKAGNGECIASLRGKGAFDSSEFTKRVSDRLTSFGGHRYAAGIRFPAESLSYVKDSFFAYCNALPEAAEEEEEEGVELLLSEITMESYALLRSFGPFGKDFEAPSFLLEVDTSSLTYSPRKKMLSTSLGKGTSIFSFLIKEGDLPRGRKAQLRGKLMLSKREEGVELEFFAEKAKLLP